MLWDQMQSARIICHNNRSAKCEGGDKSELHVCGFGWYWIRESGGCYLEKERTRVGRRRRNELNEGIWLREKVTWLLDQKKSTKRNG